MIHLKSDARPILPFLFLAERGLMAARGPSLVVARGGYSFVVSGFSLQRLLLRGPWALGHGLRQLRHTALDALQLGTWNLLRQETEPVSPAPAGGFFSHWAGRDVLILESAGRV